jgi:hypothetical protein
MKMQYIMSEVGTQILARFPFWKIKNVGLRDHVVFCVFVCVHMCTYPCTCVQLHVRAEKTATMSWSCNTTAIHLSLSHLNCICLTTYILKQMAQMFLRTQDQILRYLSECLNYHSNSNYFFSMQTLFRSCVSNGVMSKMLYWLFQHTDTSIYFTFMESGGQTLNCMLMVLPRIYNLWFTVGEKNLLADFLSFTIVISCLKGIIITKYI